MALLAKISSNLGNRLERKIADWRPVKGDHSIRVKGIEAAYLMGVMFALLLSMSLVGRSGLAVLMILACAVAAVSERFLKPVAIRMIYDLMAPKFGWPSWEAGLRKEKEQMEEEEKQDEQTVAGGTFRKPANLFEAIFRRPPNADAVETNRVADSGRAHRGLSEKSVKALRIWADLDKSARQRRAMDVATFLAKEEDHPMLGMLGNAEEANKSVVAEVILKALAAENNLDLVSAEKV